MPGSFLDEGGGEAGEADADVVLAGGGVEAETAGKEFLHREVLWTGETGLGELDGADAAEVEAAEVFPFQIVGEEVPLALDAGEVVGAHMARLRFGRARFLVGESQFDGLAQGGADGLKGFGADGGVPEIVEGDEGGEVVGFHGDLFGEGVGEFLEGGLERLLKGCAGEFSEGFLREDEGDEFALGDGEPGEALDLASQVVTVVAGIVFYGEIEGIAKVIDVPPDGSAFDFKFPGEFGAVGVVALLQSANDGADAA